MGSFDGAEVSKLVGLYLLHHLAKIFGKEAIGLYRYDGLAILLNASGPDAERMRKKVTEFFEYHQLKVTVDTNLIQTDFLDVTLNLSTGRYWPYRKPNDQPLYINVQSNHLPLITKKLPCMIVKRISEISCDVDAFNRSLPMYEQALEQSGYKIQPLSFERATGKKKFDREEEKLYGSIHHITIGFPLISGKPSSTSCESTSRHQTSCIKSATKMSSNSATAVPPTWQTSSQHTIRGFLSFTMASQNVNPVIADISRHAH